MGIVELLSVVVTLGLVVWFVIKVNRPATIIVDTTADVISEIAVEAKSTVENWSIKNQIRRQKSMRKLKEQATKASKKGVVSIKGIRKILKTKVESNGN